ncbi:hypothetical protein EDD18DRAFT_1328532 [Armillaria luteobubalina]|uniref:Uncharacterized protein n=1 Tax=Armillaria luteobubalina TaxID=153913 RepID=A0AA39QH76_9AGAR|nr:hypothetical protein EDD18DRAFT_1328532 [Armillaria luteobubalina]
MHYRPFLSYTFYVLEVVMKIQELNIYKTSWQVNNIRLKDHIELVIDVFSKKQLTRSECQPFQICTPLPGLTSSCKRIVAHKNYLTIYFGCGDHDYVEAIGNTYTESRLALWVHISSVKTPRRQCIECKTEIGVTSSSETTTALRSTLTQLCRGDNMRSDCRTRKFQFDELLFQILVDALNVYKSYKGLFASPVCRGEVDCLIDLIKDIFIATAAYLKWTRKPHITIIDRHATPPSSWEERNKRQFKTKRYSMRDVRGLFIRPTPTPRVLEAEIIYLKQSTQIYEEALREERDRLSQEKDDLVTSHRREVAELKAKISGLEESNSTLVLDVGNHSIQLPQSVDASPKYKNTAVGPDTSACAIQREKDRLVSEISGLKAQVTSLLASLRNSKGMVDRVALLESQKKKLQSDMGLMLAELEREKTLRKESHLKLDRAPQRLIALDSILYNERSNSKAEIQQPVTKNEAETDKVDLTTTYLDASQEKVDNLEARIRGLNVKLMASEDEYRRHKTYLESEVKRLLHQREKKQIELNGSQVTMRALKVHIRDLRTELTDSQKLVAELEGYQQKAAELEGINARLVPDLDSAQRLVKLMAANNEVLLQKIVELRVDDTHLKIETARLTGEIVSLLQALREYEEEKEVEEAVLNLDEDESFTEGVSSQPLESDASSAVSGTSDFVFSHAETPPLSLEESSSALSEQGALKGMNLDDNPFSCKDQGGTKTLSASPDVADYVLVQNPFADPPERLP